MPEIGQAYVQVSGDFTPLQSQLAGAFAPSKFGKLGKAAGVGLAAGFAAAGIGKVLFDVGKEFDDAYDNIRTQTGATGKEMGKLKKAFRDTIGSVPTDFDTAAKAVAGLNQRLETTGKPLARLSKQLTALSEVTGTDITENVEAVTRLFGDWSIKTKDQTDTLDGLFRLTQQTGGSVSELSRLLVQFGAPLRNLGIDLDFAAAMFANFERSGVNISTVLSGLRLSVGNLATPTDELSSLLEKLGINAAKPEKALGQIFADIKRLDDQASKALAIEVFGKRAGPDLRDAVVTGRFALQDLIKEFRNGDGTIRDSERRTRDLSEQWKLFTNRLKTVVEPVARDVFKGLGDLMRDVNKAFKEGGLEGVADLIADKLKEAIPKVANAAGKVGAKIVPALIEGFLKAPLWAQLLGGAWILGKIGGKGVFRAAGSKVGQIFALAFIAAWEAKKIAEIISGEVLDGTTRELKAAELEKAGFRSIEFIGKGMISAISSGGTWKVFQQKNGKFVETAISSWKELKREFPKIADEAGREMVNRLTGHTKSLSNRVAPHAKSIADLFDRQTDRGADAVDRNLKRGRDDAERHTRGIARDTEGNLGKAEQSAKTHGKGAGRGISQPYEAASSSVVEALHRIESNTNSSLKELKQKPINFAIVDGKKTGTSGLQRGGLPRLVGGQGTGDIVPAMLEPGEVVLNRRAVRALGGAGKANRINKRFPRFQEGGEVGGLDFALGPETVPPIQYDPLHAGSYSHWHISGSPSSWVVGIGKQLQQMGFTVGEHPAFGGITADHGHYGPTDHWHGGAIDVNSAADETHAETVKVAQLLKGAGVSGAVAEKIARVLIKGPNHVAKNIAQGVSDLAVRGANQFLSKFAPPELAGAGGLLTGSGDVEKVFASTAKKLSTSKTATLALGMAGYAESGMQDLAGGMDSSQGSLQLLASTASDMGIDPHDEAAVASAFLLRGYYGKGGANQLAAQGLPAHLVAQGVQGSAFSSGSNYAAQKGAAQGWMRRYGLQRGGIVQRLQNGGAVFDPSALMGPVRGHGGETPSTPLADWFEVMFGTEPVNKMKTIIGGIGLDAPRFEGFAKSQSDALDFDDFSTTAMALDYESPAGEMTWGMYGGRTAFGGLGSDAGSGWMDLQLLELFQLRNRMVTAIPVVEALTSFVKDKVDKLTKPGKKSYQAIAEKLYNAAKRAYERLKERIAALERQIAKLEGIKKPPKDRIELLKKKLASAKDNLGIAKVWMDAAKFRVGAVGDVSAAFSEKGTALAGITTQLKTDGAEDGTWPSLEELQGRRRGYEFMSELGPPGTLGGRIFEVQTEIIEALRSFGERTADVTDTAGTGEPSALETLSAELLQQQLEEERRRRVVAESQLPVFEQFFGGGTFHSGGIIGGIGEQGVIAQAGEGIFTEEQMAAMGSQNVTVVVEDGAVDPNKIRVVVNDELSSVAARATRVGGTKGQKAVYR